MFDWIDVSYKVYSTKYSITKALNTLSNTPIMSLDFEVQSIYTLDERKEAKELLKCCKEDMSIEDTRLSKMVAKSTGLSYPEITKVTHVIFGLSESESIILIVNNKNIEQYIMDWLVNHQGKLVIHNSLFDMKLIFHRTGKFLQDYDDTQLLARCLINHTQDWQCKTGLKHLMSGYYNPKWQEIDTYDVQDYKDEAFLRYSSIDGAATFKLWNQLQEHIDE